MHKGKLVGAPLFDLYRELQTILWPDYDHHEWSDLILRNILNERLTSVQASKDAGKSHVIAKYALTDYFCFPDETLILMSSTDIRGLELRVWGETKDLFNKAREVWDDAPGNVVDSMHAIFTDTVDTETGEARDARKGCICIPVLNSQGEWQGLGKWIGIKQKRRRVIGDEVQMYKGPYLSTLSNLNKGDFKGIFAGNPIGNGDPLDRLSEPEEGWTAQPEVNTTCTWKTRMGGVCVQLVGSDSPAIKNPGKYKYLINQQDIDWIIKAYGPESPQYWNQAMGIRRPGIEQFRIVTRDMARAFGAQDTVIWRGGSVTSIYALDAAYGGDRCVGLVVRFGKDINEKQVLSVGRPMIIPIRIYPKSTPEEDRFIAEDQISLFVKTSCELAGIPPENVFYDSTGRGSLGTSFARTWSASVNPIEFGGNPTPRPVCSDMFIYDDKLRQRRLKRADEHYSKKVTELAFSVRYTIESGQMRDLGEDILDELCARQWTTVRGDKIEAESKEDVKLRIGRSCDFADALAIAVEGARRRGFNISKLELPQESDSDDGWKKELRDRVIRSRQSYTLNYSTR